MPKEPHTCKAPLESTTATAAGGRCGEMKRTSSLDGQGEHFEHTRRFNDAALAPMLLRLQHSSSRQKVEEIWPGIESFTDIMRLSQQPQTQGITSMIPF